MSSESLCPESPEDTSEAPHAEAGGTETYRPQTERTRVSNDEQSSDSPDADGCSNASQDSASTDDHDAAMLHDLSLSMIDFDHTQFPQISGRSVLDMLETSFSEEEFVKVQRRSKRLKVFAGQQHKTPSSSSISTTNRFAALEDIEGDIDIIKWPLSSVTERVTHRIAINSRVVVPTEIALNVSDHQLPVYVTTPENSTIILYARLTPLLDVCRGIKATLEAVNARTPEEESNAAICNAMGARFALKSYDDPSVLVGDIVREPLAHIFAFTSELQHDLYSMNSAIRLHTIQQSLATTDAQLVRSFDECVKSHLTINTHYERSTVLNRFKQLADATSDNDCVRCLNVSDALSLFELLLMMIAPAFFTSSTLLSAYIKSPVMWLLGAPIALLHPLTLALTLMTPLGRYITDHATKIQPANSCINELNCMCTDTEGLASFIDCPRDILIDGSAGVLIVREQSAPTAAATRC